MTRRGYGFSLVAAVVGLLVIQPVVSLGQEDPQLQALVDELSALTEKSRDQRAADRWLQQALEDLVAKYHWPWRKELLSEDFSDGDYTRNPAWTVQSGKFWVDQSLGLRSRVEVERRAKAEESTQESGSQQDVGRQILGTIAKEVFKEKGSSRETTSARKQDREMGPASIRVAAAITNAFLLKMSFSMHNEPGVEGAFEIALFQDERGDFGYTLAVDEAGLMDLHRLRRGRRELVNGSKLENNVGDGSVHDLVWRQAGNGQVEVLMDETKIMNLRDNAFSEGYQWLELTNLGGELSVRSVRVSGTR